MSEFMKCRICGAGSFFEGMIGDDGLCADCRAESDQEACLEYEKNRMLDEACPDRLEHEAAVKRLEKIREQNMARVIEENRASDDTGNERDSHDLLPPDHPMSDLLDSMGVDRSNQREWLEWFVMPPTEQRRLLLCHVGFCALRGIGRAETIQAVVALCEELRAGVIDSLAAAQHVVQTEREPEKTRQQERESKDGDSPVFFGMSTGE